MSFLKKLFGISEDKKNTSPKKIKISETDNSTESLAAIVSNAEKAAWNNQIEVVKLKDAIKKTWFVDLQVLNLTEQQSKTIKQKAPLNSNFRNKDDEYQVKTSNNSIFIHAYGSFIDFGYIMFWYKNNIYYVNVEPTVQLKTSIFNRIDILSHLTKIMIVLNKQIGSERKTLLIRLDGELEQKAT